MFFYVFKWSIIFQLFVSVHFLQILLAEEIKYVNFLVDSTNHSNLTIRSMPNATHEPDFKNISVPMNITVMTTSTPLSSLIHHTKSNQNSSVISDKKSINKTSQGYSQCAKETTISYLLWTYPLFCAIGVITGMLFGFFFHKHSFLFKKASTQEETNLEMKNMGSQGSRNGLKIESESEKKPSNEKLIDNNEKA